MTPQLADAVVFDMDGTLIDSLAVVCECYRMTVLEFDGPNLIPDQILSAFAIGPAALMLESLIGRAVGTEAIARYEERLKDQVGFVTVYDGVKETLSELAARVPVGVFTAADTSAAELLLEAVGLRSDVGPVIGADQTLRPKPAPDGLMDACRMLGVATTNAAYVGDGPADVFVARSCGALAVAAGWGHQYDEDRDVDVTVAQPRDLLDLVASRDSSGGRV